MFMASEKSQVVAFRGISSPLSFFVNSKKDGLSLCQRSFHEDFKNHTDSYHVSASMVKENPTFFKSLPQPCINLWTQDARALKTN